MEKDTKYFTELLKKYAQNLDILYVEDDEFVRSSTSKLFEKFFKSVDIAEDGLLGLEKYQSGTYDLIVTDLNMPNMDGIEMSQKIKDIDFRQPIVVISAHNESELLLSLIDIGVDGFLLKPIRTEQLLRSLSSICANISDTKMLRSYQSSMEDAYAELQRKLEAKLEAENKNTALSTIMADQIEISDIQLKYLTSSTGLDRVFTPSDVSGRYKIDVSQTSACLKELESDIESNCSKLSNSIDEETLQLLSQQIFAYSEELKAFHELSNLYFAIEQLSSVVFEINSNNLSKISELMRDVLSNLKKWRYEVLDNHEAINIHFVDQDVISKVMMIISLTK
jgi:YesN/AraC family two-component response regulator